MSLHVIVGAGPVGTATALLLAERGERVRLVTRRGTGPEHPAVERVTADATDAGRLAELAEGAAALYNCAAPPYHRWAAEWPPLAAAVLGAAESAGAVLATTSNLYGYGPVDGAMTERTPLRATGVKGRVRARLWEEALAAHEAGRVRVTEVRGSDYLGAGTLSLLTAAALPAALAGRRARVPADLDAPHSWTYVGDVARTLVAVAADERAWGRPWHVPTAPPRSIRGLTTLACSIAGAPTPRLAAMPRPVLWLGGLFDPLVRELRETQYQFRRPFVLDSTAATETFAITPTPIEDSLAETVQALPR
ncbi:NAD-dependent epimerase/dehydratase family protein [Streptomyces sp. 8K308]|uniref:NAD-dependent epimerase/dehydratase family protein n=1 Tax=Streptomyces sp. 8K308 TaxID=2530388 RepID=UPI00105146FD|nr:NAD-dependent epimerase/dehydratase family protein [Streptomyces sp. 8K308]TDC24717.1 NAD-dependent epimerase/dehydratase family protein [Streptomyces sp. 8K308]